MEEALGVNSCIMAHTVFRGQNFFDGLLEASDVRLKEDLSLVVPLEVWRGAASTAQLAAREEAGRSTELGGGGDIPAAGGHQGDEREGRYCEGGVQHQYGNIR